MVKNLLSVQETQVRSLGWDDPLDKEMTTYSSVLAWEMPWTEKPGRGPWTHKELDTAERLTLHSSCSMQTPQLQHGGLAP